MPAIASNIPTPQLALNNKANMGLPSLGLASGGTQTTTAMSQPNTYVSPGTVAPRPAAPQAPQPSTPLKSTTTTAPNGASVTNTYHPPATPQTATGGSTGLPPAPIAPLASANLEPSYNPNQPATTVYNNGVATTYQNGVQVSGYTPQVPQTQSQGTTTASSPTSFPGIVSGLASTAAQGSPNATTATTGLLAAPSQNANLVAQAQQIGTQYGNDIEKTSNYGNALAGSYTNGAGLAPVSQGLAGQAQQTTAAEVQGEQAAEQAALNPINQELAAQAQGQSGLAAAGGIANTQQANVQSGLGAAGQLAQPSATGAGQTTYNPLTNSFSGGSSSGDPTQAPSGYTQADWNQIVSNVANGNLSAISGLPTVLQSQAQAAAQAQNPNFNINTAQGQALGQQSVGAAGGTAAAQNTITSSTAAGTVSAAQTVQIASYQSAQQQGQNLISQAKDLISTFGLNPSELNAANGAIQKIAQNTSSPQYQELSNYLNDIASRYAQILTPPGGSATDQTRAIAQSMLNSTAQGTSLEQVMDSLDQQASAVINGVRTTTPTSQASNSGTTAPSATGAGGGWASLGD